MKSILFIATGSGLGGVLRYSVHLLVQRFYPSAFPVATLVVNIVGCFLIGIFFSLAQKAGTLSPDAKLFLVTGFCGGFTTFSAFSLDSISLFKSGQLIHFLLYLTGSIVFSIMATIAGMYIAR
jgi:CrcB protein